MTVRYVVACRCTGSRRALAYIDDDRAARGGELRIVKVPWGVSGQSFVGRPGRRIQPRDPGAFARRWQNAEFTSIDSSGAILRCADCSNQAQLNRKTLAKVAEYAAAAAAAGGLTPVTDSREVNGAMLAPASGRYLHLDLAGYLWLEDLVRALSRNFK